MVCARYQVRDACAAVAATSRLQPEGKPHNRVEGHQESRRDAPVSHIQPQRRGSWLAAIGNQRGLQEGRNWWGKLKNGGKAMAAFVVEHRRCQRPFPATHGCDHRVPVWRPTATAAGHGRQSWPSWPPDRPADQWVSPAPGTPQGGAQKKWNKTSNRPVLQINTQLRGRPLEEPKR